MRATQMSQTYPPLVPCPPPMIQPLDMDARAICVYPVTTVEALLLYPRPPEAPDLLPPPNVRWEVGDYVLVPEHGLVRGIITSIRSGGYYTVLSESVQYRVRGASSLRPSPF